MDLLLKQLPLDTDADILIVHNFALQLAGKAGLSILEQLSFAMRVTQHCSQYHQNKDRITFSVTKLKDVCILKAYTEISQGLILVEIPQHAVDAAVAAMTEKE